MACFRYVAPKKPDWFLIEFAGPNCGATFDDDVAFDDVGELEAFLAGLEVIWSEGDEAIDTLRSSLPAHFHKPGLLEKFTTWFWNHLP